MTRTPVIAAAVAAAAAAPAATKWLSIPGSNTTNIVETFAESHDLAVADLGENQYRFTPRNGEPCDATLTRTVLHLELTGDCLDRVTTPRR